MPSSPPSSPSPPPQPTPVRASVYGCDLELSLAPDQPRLVIGEPVFLTFRIETACAKKLAVLDGGDYRNRFGRAETYELTAVSASGKNVPVIEIGPGFGGLTGPVPLAKDKPFAKRLLLAHWFDFTEPGTFAITVRKKLSVGEAMTPDTKDKTIVPVDVTANVEVLPASPAVLGRLIDALGKDALGKDERASNEAVENGARRSEALPAREDQVSPGAVPVGPPPYWQAAVSFCLSHVLPQAE